MSNAAENSRETKHVPSLEGRLVFYFAAGAAVLLIAMSGAIYEAIGHYLNARMVPIFAAVFEDTADDLNQAGGVRQVAGELAAPHQGPMYVWERVIDQATGASVETPGMALKVPPAEFPTAPPTGINRRDSTRGSWMSFAVQTMTAGGHRFTVQVAEDRSADQDFLRELRFLLGAILLTGLFCSAAMASIVTRRGLYPLQAMERAVGRVRLPKFNERLCGRSWPRELAPLALAFDQMLDRLQETFSRLSQFSADLAHELRTPLANLRGEAEVALSRARSADEYRQVLESSVEEYVRLSEMASRLLFLARADAAEAEVSLRDVDARAVIDPLLEFYKPYAEEQGVTMHASGNAALKADEVLLRRALANLIENALHFTPAGGRVEVMAGDGGESGAGPHRILVRDTGCGIAPEHLPRLFERFFQADPARRKGGAGLGLALVKSIMKLHGGSVTIASHPGAGTEATLLFPT